MDLAPVDIWQQLAGAESSQITAVSLPPFVCTILRRVTLHLSSHSSLLLLWKRNISLYSWLYQVGKQIGAWKGSFIYIYPLLGHWRYWSLLSHSKIVDPDSVLSLDNTFSNNIAQHTQGPWGKEGSNWQKSPHRLICTKSHSALA